MNSKVWMVILGLGLGFTVVSLVGMAMDRWIDDQNRMLCRSAQVSGNEEYTEKCQAYYSTGDIEYLR